MRIARSPSRGTARSLVTRSRHRSCCAEAPQVKREADKAHLGDACGYRKVDPTPLDAARSVPRGDGAASIAKVTSAPARPSGRRKRSPNGYTKRQLVAKHRSNPLLNSGRQSVASRLDLGAIVAVVEPTDLRSRDDTADRRRHHGTRNRRVLVERQMRARLHVVRDVAGEHPL